MTRWDLIEAVGGMLLVAGLSMLQLWLGVSVAGVLLMVAANGYGKES